MKRIILPALVSALCACGVEDKGNYDYRAAEDVVPKIVTEFEPMYSSVMLTRFVLDPQMEGNEDDYEYTWCTYPSGVTTIGRRDTIGRERALDYTVGLAPGSYNLVFQARDRQTGTSSFRHTILSVTGAFGAGYFVQKYENGQTDIDFIDAGGTVRANVLQTVNGRALAGRPVRMTLSDRYCYPAANADGSSTVKIWQHTVVVASEEDMSIYSGTDMTEIYDWDHAFMEAPPTRKPQGVWGTRSGFIMLNDGKLHVLGGATYSTGQFGYEFPAEGLRLSSKGAVATSNIAMFDENSGALVAYSTTQNRYAYTEPNPQTIQHHFAGQELVALEAQLNYVGSTSHCFALLRSGNAGEEGKLRLVDVQAGYANTFQSMVYYGSYELPAEAANAGNGKAFSMKNGTGTSGGNSVLYYSTGDNAVHYYNYMTQTHTANALTIPADERIAYIYHNCDYMCNGGHPTYSAFFPDGYNSFLVLSNKGGNWTLREYGMVGATPDIDAAKLKATYTGTGEATSLFYRWSATNTTW